MVKITILGSCKFEPYEILAMPNKLDAELYKRNHEKAYDVAFETVFKKAIDESDIVFVYAPNGVGEHTGRDLEYTKSQNKPFVVYQSRLKKYLDHPFFKFYMAMIDTYLKHEPEKGDSWRECSWSYLMDKLCNQIEDMQNDPDREDYYANIGNYSAMLWYNNKEDV